MWFENKKKKCRVQAPITTYIHDVKYIGRRLTNESEIPNFSLSSAGMEA